jgi:hypothetical protein
MEIIRQLIQIGRGDITQSDLNEKRKASRAMRARSGPKSPTRKTLDSALKKLALGLAKDNPERLRAAADYLERQAEFERLAPYLNLTINHARRRPAEHPSDQELIK